MRGSISKNFVWMKKVECQIQEKGHLYIFKRTILYPYNKFICRNSYISNEQIKRGKTKILQMYELSTGLEFLLVFRTGFFNMFFVCFCFSQKCYKFPQMFQFFLVQPEGAPKESQYFRGFMGFRSQRCTELINISKDSC